MWERRSISIASDRYAADLGSIPRCGKGFFFPFFFRIPAVNFVSVDDDDDDDDDHDA